MLDLGVYHKFLSDTYFQGKAWIYNGSATQLNDRIYYVCRVREALNQAHYQSHIVFQPFDSEWKIVSPPRVLPIITDEIKDMDTGPQDARIFVYRNDVWVVFNMLNKDSVRRMHIYNVSNSAGGNAKALMIDNMDRGHTEKNWTPFVFNGNLFFIYCFFPLVVLLCDTVSGTCKVVYKGDNRSIDVNKSFRGGSPATLVKDNTFVGWLHTTSATTTTFDSMKLPVPAQQTKSVYRTCRFELEWGTLDKPKLTIGSEIVFNNNQIEQVYGSVDNGLILNLDDCKTVVVEK
jgi:hypothetical protein